VNENFFCKRSEKSTRDSSKKVVVIKRVGSEEVRIIWREDFVRNKNKFFLGKLININTRINKHTKFLIKST